MFDSSFLINLSLSASTVLSISLQVYAIFFSYISSTFAIHSLNLFAPPPASNDHWNDLYLASWSPLPKTICKGFRPHSTHKKGLWKMPSSNSYLVRFCLALVREVIANCLIFKKQKHLQACRIQTVRYRKLRRFKSRSS